MSYPDTKTQCPEWLRITDGPRYTSRSVPWPPDQKFYKITDLDTGTILYRTSVEASVICDVKLSTFKSRLKKKKKKAVFHNRWEVQRIPRFVFIQKTKRTEKILRDYFWRY